MVVAEGFGHRVSMMQLSEPRDNQHVSWLPSTLPVASEHMGELTVHIHFGAVCAICSDVIGKADVAMSTRPDKWEEESLRQSASLTLSC